MTNSLARIILAAVLLMTPVSYAFAAIPQNDGSESSAVMESSIDDGDNSANGIDPDYDEATGSFAESWRFQGGVPVDLLTGIETYSMSRSGINSWWREGDEWVSTDGTRVSGAKGMGIDVSHWQGQIDWKRVKESGVSYAIISCGWGSDYSFQDDANFIQNIRGCQENGIAVGVYIYSYAYNESMAQSEAYHVLRCLSAAGLSPSNVQYPIYIDLENEAGTGRPCGEDNGQKIPISNSMLAKIAETFCNTIEAVGYKAGVYANLNWWNNYLTDPAFRQWPKWIAQYDSRCTYSGPYGMWQCMSDGNIPGVQGNVDVNFDFEGASAPSGASPISTYRMYNSCSGEHLYTQDANEKNVLSSIGWTCEGVAWVAPSVSSVPVYRLYNPNSGDHHYTISVNERDVLSSIGWTYEGVAWYSDDAQEEPVYRLYNPYELGAGSHHYTLSENEKNVLSGGYWTYEGIAWYAMKEE